MNRLKAGELRRRVVRRDVQLAGLGYVRHLLGRRESLPLDVDLHGIHRAQLEIWQILADAETLLAGA